MTDEPAPSRPTDSETTPNPTDATPQEVETGAETRRCNPMGFKPDWLPMAVGSVPSPDPAQGWALILKYLPEIPVWPQLPRCSYLENMYAQF